MNIPPKETPSPKDSQESMGYKVPALNVRDSLATPVSSKIGFMMDQLEAPLSREDFENGPSTMMILDHPEVEDPPSGTLTRSSSLLSQLAARGMETSQVPYTVYSNPKSVGIPLRYSVQDEMKGYENLYDNEAHFSEILQEVRSLSRRLYKKAAGIVDEIKDNNTPDLQLSIEQKVALAEVNDAEAIGMIRTKALGWFLDPPIALDIKASPPSSLWASTLDRVALRYAESIRSPKLRTAAGETLPYAVTLSMSDSDLRDKDSDPSDTLTGLPLLASGTETIPARVAMLAAAPPFTLRGGEWLQAYRDSLAAETGLPRELILGATIANRTSAFRKPRLVWSHAPGGYAAKYLVRGLGSRVRNVFPIPFPINYAMAPAYKQMSFARMQIPGLWHGPADWSLMLKDLTAPGKVIVSADYSGMDTRISPSVVQTIANSLMKAGFSKFSCEVLANVQKMMSVFTPSYLGEKGSSTMMRGVIPWLSGYKLTSELDTIYGVATTLAALSRQKVMSDVVDRWVKGTFILYELGDDTIFSLTPQENDAIDWDLFTIHAREMVGAAVVKDIAPVFLKKIVINGQSSPRMISRVIQQTFFNENRNDGKPPIVSLIGLKARIEGLKAHPWFDDFYPEFLRIVSKTKFAREVDLGNLLPDTPLTASQNAQLIQYAESLNGRGWLADLIEQAKYSKAAADSLKIINSALGKDSILDDADRRLYREAMLRTPTQEEKILLQSARARFFRR